MSDIILPEISEVEMLLGTSDEKEIADKFIAMGCKIVAVKLGADGCYAASGDDGSYIKGFTEREKTCNFVKYILIYEL